MEIKILIVKFKFNNKKKLCSLFYNSVNDMKKNALYFFGYDEGHHAVIDWFWEILHTFTEEEK